VQVRSLWQQAIDPKRPLPPAVVSYDYTMFNLSLPNNRNDLLKEALTICRCLRQSGDYAGNRQLCAEQQRHGGDLAWIPKRAGGAIA
jgi:hypothetical protein